jgi:predicted DNA-binding transcriptional regulator AlpA
MSAKTISAQSRVTEVNQDEVNALLKVISNGCGEELLTTNQLKLTGSHPFSNSTRRRKIKNNEYPKPIKISPQMSLWKAGEIRRWRQDPSSYRASEGEIA